MVRQKQSSRGTTKNVLGGQILYFFFYFFTIFWIGRKSLLSNGPRSKKCKIWLPTAFSYKDCDERFGSIILTSKNEDMDP